LWQYGIENQTGRNSVDLQYDTEHEMLRDSAVKLLAGHKGPALWSEFAKAGWLGLPFSENDGGLGAGAVEVSVLMDIFGKVLVNEPYVPCVILAGGVVAALGSGDERGALLPKMIDGKTKLAFADTGAVVARKAGKGFRLSGTKKTVLGAPSADTILVLAEIGFGHGVFALPKDTRGLVVRGYPTIDGREAADVELSDVETGEPLGGRDDAGEEVELARDRAITALSAEAVGAMATMVETTVEYTKTRVQFGQPIAKFQALQHRMVDMKVKEEEARASTLFATLSLDAPTQERRRAVSGAKAKVGRAGRFIHQSAIQLHGAIGTTQELTLGNYAKRLIAYEALFGTTREHLRKYGALIADPALAAANLLQDPS
jgi:alkylation response protein AidB-like acyl-CoA dehydrogenase